MSIADPDDAEKARRAAHVEQAAQIAAVGDVQVSEQWRADAARYVAGEITADEFVAITRARYGAS